ncbi:MAG: hypothetical protein MUE81_10775 [Thermoflexibacter sp.]|jgi:hypothetical protein|nr:hypothetical protein [Thermoflexibacter sp.]
MSSEEKKAFLLLKSVIFQYHGLDEDEQQLLDDTVASLDAKDESEWVKSFISEDYYDAFDRARNYLVDVMNNLDRKTRISFLESVCEDNNKKGYISEMEAIAMITFARDWDIENEFIEIIKR